MSRGSRRWLAHLVAAAVVAGTVSAPLPARAPVPVLAPAPAAASTGAAQLGLEDWWSALPVPLAAGWAGHVDTATGGLVLVGPVHDVRGRGPALVEKLVHDSRSSVQDGLGLGWSLSSSQSVQPVDGGVVWRDEDGTEHRFARQADGSLTAPAGVHMTLTAPAAGVFELVDKDQVRSRFEGGRLVRVTDAAGNALTLSRAEDGRPAVVRDAGGRTLTYERNASGRLTGVVDPAGRRTAFGHDSAGRLTSVTDATGATTRVAYDAAGRVAALTDARGATTGFRYDAAGRVVAVVDPRSTATDEVATLLSYDASSSTTTVTDPAGGVSRVVHNSAGNPVSRTDASGVTTTTEWLDNKPVKATDAAGSVTTSYDAAGNVTRTTETVDPTRTASTTTTFDGRSNPVSVADPNGTRVQLSYDAASNLTSQALPVRREADVTTYDANGNQTSSTDIGAASSSLVRNGSFERVEVDGRPVGWYVGGATTAVSVDRTSALHGSASLRIATTTPETVHVGSELAPVVAGQALTVQGSASMASVSGTGVALGVEFYDSAFAYLGAEYTNSYTGTGVVPLLATATAPAGAAYAAVVVEHALATGTVHVDGVQLEAPVQAAEGHLLSRFDAVDNSSFELGASGWYAGGPSGAATITTASAYGGLRSARLALTTTGTAFLVSERTGVRSGEPLTLSGFLRLTDVAGGRARLQVQYYDAAGTLLAAHATTGVQGSSDWTRHAVATTAPSGAATAEVYVVLSSATGSVLADVVKLVPRATTTYAYDSTGSYLTRTTDPTGLSTTYAYDAVGNLTSTTNPAGGTTRLAYDAQDRPVEVVDPAGGTTRYAYDSAGLGLVLRDARSSGPTDDTFATRYGYDAARQRMAMTDPLGRATSYQHDRAGRLSRTTNPSGSSVSYAYTPAGRPASIALSDGSRTAYGYDASGNPTSVTRSAPGEPELVSSYEYDAAHQLHAATDPWGLRRTSTRDAAGQVTSVSDSDGRTTRLTHGADGRLLEVVDPSGRTTRFRYDEVGRPFEVLAGNGLRAVVSHDAAGRTQSIADPGNPAGRVLYYDYDSRGNLTSLVTASGQHRFTHDALGRLTGWTRPDGAVTAYAYDATGNLTRKGDRTFTHDAAGQITSPGFSHDADGNLTGDGVRRYAWDAAGRLVRVTRAADGALVAAYRYDHRGLRIEKTTPAGTVRYSWDEQSRLVREVDGAGTVLARYTWGEGNRLVALERGGVVHYPHVNARGDVLGVTDASGRRVAAYEYGPWGELLSETGTLSQPWRYAGYYADVETGLYYVQQRYYSPELGRFLSKEPMFGDFCSDCGFQALLDSAPTTSPYAYVDDRPLTFVDPDGRHPVVAGAVLACRLLCKAAARGASRAGKAAYNAVRGGAKPKVPPPAYRSFTSSNYRHNLAVRTGMNPSTHHAHHVFPRKFAGQFQRAGLNIHDPKYLSWWQANSHLRNASGYNQAWAQFFARTPRPTQAQILGFGRSLMRQYGVPVGF